MTGVTVAPSVRSPPRWATVAAHLAALAPLPSGVWRLALVLGFSGGYTEQGLVELDLGGWGTAYVVGLTVLTELAALLTLGLVRPWGERVPSWVPALGGRPVPPLAAVVPAGVGAVLLLALWTPLLWWWTLQHHDMTPAGATAVGFLYLPLVAWGPLLVAVTVSYHRRRLQGQRSRTDRRRGRRPAAVGPR